MLLRILIGMFFFVSLGCYSNDKVNHGIKLINSQEFKEAQEVLSSRDLSKNAKALFWLAVAEYENGDRFKAGDTFEKAAELGNPWAMARLVPEWDNPCGLLGWPCSSSWKNKAIKQWKKFSAQGSGKAIYALAKYDKPWWYKIPYYRDGKLFEIAKLGLSKGGIAFLTDHSFWHGNESDYIEYLKKAAESDYAPAMAEIANFIVVPVEERIKYLKRGVNLGYSGAAESLALFYRFGFSNFPKSGSKSYYYGEITKGFSLSTFNNDVDVLEETASGEKKIVRIVTEEEQGKIEREAQEFLSKVKPNLFWNENTVDLY